MMPMKLEVMLSVPSIEETAAWYKRVLGWEGHYDIFGGDGKCDFGSVKGDEECYFNLIRYDQGDAPYPMNHPNTTFHIIVDDVDVLYRRIAESGWNVSRPPENQIWGGRTFSIDDLNGFSLVFIQYVERPSLEEIRRRSSHQADTIRPDEKS